MDAERTCESEIDLWTTFRPPVRVYACTYIRAERERKKMWTKYIHTYMRTHAQQENYRGQTAKNREMNRQTDEQMARPRTFSFLLLCVFYVHWYSDSMRERERERGGEKEPLKKLWSAQNPFTAALSTFLQHKFFLFAFLTPYSTMASRRFCSSSTTALRVLLSLSSTLPPPTPSLTTHGQYTFKHMHTALIEA